MMTKKPEVPIGPSRREAAAPLAIMPSKKTRGRGRPFTVGNQYRRGRPVGSRNNATLALEQLLEGEGEAITRKAIELAKSGNEFALRLCLERLVAPRRERSVSLRFPSDLRTAAGISAATEVVLAAVAAGEITAGEGAQIGNLLEVRRKAIETEIIERRLTELEATLNER